MVAKILKKKTNSAYKESSDPQPRVSGFAFGLVKSVLNLPVGLVKFFGGIQITEELKSILLIKIFFRLVEMTFGMVHASSY